jgi:uncharacterized damage-inducible protein DinB
MSDQKQLQTIIEQALTGEGAHVATRTVFDGLDWQSAGALPAGAGHSIFQLANHMNFWQDWALEWLEGGTPKIPRHASGSWPGALAPAGAKEWKAAVRRFQDGLGAMLRHARKGDLFVARGKRTRLGMFQTMALHSSHHAGQVVTLRQMLGKWPPPSGGVTW